MMVHLRQLAHGLRGRLLTGPVVFVFLGVVLAVVMPEVDQAVGGDAVPRGLRTTIEGGRAVLTAIASGLISSVTLLLSLVLVAVQLASSQFSPRTLRDWTGDATQQIAIGLVLGTSVYCLLVLRETRALGDDAAVPHLSVLVAVTLGVCSLLAVVRAVDALTKRLRIGSVVRSISERTLAMVDLDQGDGRTTVDHRPAPKPSETVVVTTPEWGWVQQIDESTILAALPDETTAELLVSEGSFVTPDAPIVSIGPPPGDGCIDVVRRSIALGEERTMQQDLEFGIVQLVDVALRALSPGINDPNTASEVIRNLGVIVLRAWARPERPVTVMDGDRTLVRAPRSRDELIESAFGPIRRHGADEASVVVAMLQTLSLVRSETLRRRLPGPIEPVDRAIAAVLEDFDRTDPSAADRLLVDQCVLIGAAAPASR